MKKNQQAITGCSNVTKGAAAVAALHEARRLIDQVRRLPALPSFMLEPRKGKR